MSLLTAVTYSCHDLYAIIALLDHQTVTQLLVAISPHAHGLEASHVCVCSCRKWLNTIPFYQPLCLTDFEVSTALNYLTLACSPLTTCSWCSRPNSLGHDELCMTRPR